MIERIRGIVIAKSPLAVTVECGGVGFALQVSARTGEAAPEVGAEAVFLTHLVVREDAWTLFGFLDAQEKEVFLRMIAVNGIGPKLAQRILSSVSPADLLMMIAQANHHALSQIKGIGKKTADMLVLALQDKALALSAVGGGAEVALPSAQQEAILALHQLGLKDPGARKAVEKAAELLGKEADSAKLIAQALQLV
jgi:Holliday junction DNA helicase RuvA